MDITLTNDGLSRDDITDFTFTGDDDFVVFSSCGDLAPGDSAQMAITFLPGAPRATSGRGDDR